MNKFIQQSANGLQNKFILFFIALMSSKASLTPADDFFQSNQMIVYLVSVY